MKLFKGGIWGLGLLAMMASAGVWADPDGAAPTLPGPVLPNLELDQQTVYQFLLGEIAAQRGDFGLATQAYLSLATMTRDPRVARRATEIALYGHDLGAAEEALGLWLREDPRAPAARETLGGLLLSQPNLQKAEPLLTPLIAADRGAEGDDFVGLNLILSQHPDHETALTLAQHLTAPYPNLPESHYFVSAQAFLAGQVGLALTQAEEANRLRPDWSLGGELEARILASSDLDRARIYMQEWLVRNPEDRDMRLLLARFLVDQKAYPEARLQFEEVLKQDPGQSDLALAVGLLDLQMKDFGAAEKRFHSLLDQGYRESDRVRFYLGQSQEEQKNWDQALHWYGLVQSGDMRVPARVRESLILAEQGQRQKALDLLRAMPAHGSDQQQQQALAEEQIQREGGDFQGAFNTLTQALAIQPDSADMLYERAIAADKLGDFTTLERDLRRVMALRPDYAHAYNALGYSLAERNLRLDEAMNLIHKALTLSPQDPFIIDSLGWVQFRMGHLRESVATLKQAYGLQADPEIASHLGEALWASGDQNDARQIWENNLKQNPDNPVLTDTIHRFLH